jgi:methionyl-tRNA formyltransferase
MPTPNDNKDRMILLTGELEFAHLEKRLHSVSADLVIEHAADIKQLEELLNDETTGRCRLVAYCTKWIIPGALLEKVSDSSYNFHPGPPDYPGSHAAGFAIYDAKDRFGVTVHEIKKAVDAGNIVAVDYFRIPVNADLEDLEIISYQTMLSLFDRLMDKLVDFEHALEPTGDKWSGRKTTIGDVEKMHQGWGVLDDNERTLRTRAFGAPVQ